MKRLINDLRKFAEERDWIKFHSPKNLAMALSVEVAELLEIFQWLTQEQSYNVSGRVFDKVKEEIGDIQIYLANLADKFGLDPIECAEEKLKINRAKYPADKVKGSAKKYDEY